MGDDIELTFSSLASFFSKRILFFDFSSGRLNILIVRGMDDGELAKGYVGRGVES